MSKKIPKIINYCWFGKNEKPDIIKKCINSWKKYCPDYEIIEWNESNFDIKINDYVKEAYEQKRYAFVSDFARLWIIYNNGGIYLDTDVELIKNIDDLIEYDAFFSSEDNVYINTGLGFGSVKENELLKMLMDDYNEIKFIKDDGTIDKTTCPVRNTKIIKKYMNNEMVVFDKKIEYKNICFLPKEYFCPLDYETRKMKITENTRAIHWFSGTWMTPYEKFKKMVRKRLIKLIKRR